MILITTLKMVIGYEVHRYGYSFSSLLSSLLSSMSRRSFVEARFLLLYIPCCRYLKRGGLESMNSRLYRDNLMPLVKSLK